MYIKRCLVLKKWTVLPLMFLLYSCLPSTSFDDTAAEETNNSKTIPSSPTHLSGVRNSRTISLSWQDNANNENAYLVEIQMDGSGWEQIAQLSANTEFTSITLTSDATYNVRVAAQNAIGVSNYSNVIELVDQSSEDAQSIIEGGTLWQQLCAGCHDYANTTNSTVLQALHNHSFIQKTITTMPPGNEGACNEDCANAIAAWLTEVTSTDSVNDGNGDDGNGGDGNGGDGNGGDGQTIPKPEAPTNADGTRLNQVVSLTWQDNATNEDRFIIQMMQTGGAWIEVARVAANITFTHVTLSTEETIYFRIFSENKTGLSSASNILKLDNEGTGEVDLIALGETLWNERECSGCHTGENNTVADYRVQSALLDDSFIEVTVATMPTSSPGSCDENCATAIQAWLQTLYSQDDTDSTKIEDPQVLPTEATLLKSLHKVSLSLGYKLPTSTWINLVKTEGEAGLEKAVRDILETDEFYWRVRDIYSPVLQGVDIPSNDYAAAIGGRAAWYNDLVGGEYRHLAGDTRWAIWDAINNEPARLIEYVIRNNLPFTEILTADYTLVNYFSARAYNVLDQVTFTETSTPSIEIFPYDANEYKKAYLPMPTAGILTSSVFMTLYPTTFGNVNRHRAYNVYKLFLDTDILDIPGSRVEADDITVENPTMENPTCTGCHNVMDPVAASFRHWQGGEYRKNNWSETGWNQETILPPGFNGVDMPEGNDAPLQWLAQRITQDPRFALSTVKTFFSEITGHPLHPVPSESDSALTKALYDYQQKQLQLFADRFIASGYQLKDLIVDLVLSDYFSNHQYLGGTSRLINKTQLIRKAQAVFNIHGFGKSHELINGYYLGSQPNGIMALMQRMAGSEIACFSVPSDIARSKEARVLLPYFEWGQVLDDDGNIITSEKESEIKKNIQNLMWVIWGESAELDSPDLHALYKTYLDIVETGLQGMNEMATTRYDYQCDNRNRFSGYDDHYGMSAWMGMINLMADDYRFLYN